MSQWIGLPRLLITTPYYATLAVFLPSSVPPAGTDNIEASIHRKNVKDAKIGDKKSLSDGKSIKVSAVVCQGRSRHVMLRTGGLRWTRASELVWCAVNVTGSKPAPQIAAVHFHLRYASLYQAGDLKPELWWACSGSTQMGNHYKALVKLVNRLPLVIVRASQVKMCLTFRQFSITISRIVSHPTRFT